MQRASERNVTKLVAFLPALMLLGNQFGEIGDLFRKLYDEFVKLSDLSLKLYDRQETLSNLIFN